MSMELWGHIVGVITSVLLVIFVGIWIWAWRAYHKTTFSRLACLPMEDKLEGESLNNDHGDKQA